MPSIYNPGPTQTPTLPYVPGIVEIRQNWGDAWLYFPYLEPIMCRRCVAPDVPHAFLRYWTGNIKRNDQTSFAQYLPEDIRDWFVRISLNYPNSDPVPIWYGYVEEESLAYMQQDIPAGQEIFKCYGLEHLLDRIAIDSSYVMSPITGNTQRMDWAIAFNEHTTKGVELIGNRAAKPVNANQPFYVFGVSPDHVLWSNLDIANYLMAAFGNPLTNLTYNIIGQTSPLTNMKEYHHMEGWSVYKALCKLIDRSRGMTFFVYVGNDDNIYLNVVTTTDIDITVGNVTLPANQNQFFLTLPTTPPYNQLVDDIPLRVTSSNLFGTIRVRSSRARMICPFSYQYGNLAAGWSNTEETNYDNALDPFTGQKNGFDPDQNDFIRDQSIYENVFVRLMVPETWDGTLNNVNVMPIPQSDGTMSFDATAETPRYWIHDKQFERQMHLKKGVDYTQTPPVDNSPPNLQPEYVEMLGFVNDTTNGTVHVATNAYLQLDKMTNQTQKQLPDVHISPTNKGLGVKIHAHPAHFMANNHFPTAGNPAPAASNTAGELDWQQVTVVGEFATDVRQRVTWKNTNDNGRVKNVNVEAARYVYCVPTCPIAASANGTLWGMPPANCILHNDLTVLQQVLAEYIGWYGVPRQAVKLKVKQAAYLADVGTILTGVNTVYSSAQIQTLVTAVTVDFAPDTGKQYTELETGFDSLDFVSLVGRGEDLHEYGEGY